MQPDSNGQTEESGRQKAKSYKCKSVPTTDWNEQTKAEEWRGAEILTDKSKYQT